MQVRCRQNLADNKKMKFFKFLNAVELILQVTDNITILARIIVDMKLFYFIATHADSVSR